GYTRVPSLVSAWSTAPIFVNNTLGRFEPSPAVDARMRSFQSSIEQLLWPERRDKDPVLGDKVPGVIDRTTHTSTLNIPNDYLPLVLQRILPQLRAKFPAIFVVGAASLRPIPAGT